MKQIFFLTIMKPIVFLYQLHLCWCLFCSFQAEERNHCLYPQWLICPQWRIHSGRKPASTYPSAQSLHVNASVSQKCIEKYVFCSKNQSLVTSIIKKKKSQTFVKENKSPERLIVRKSPYYFIKRKKPEISS